MRRAGDIVVGILWILFIAMYSAPLWLSRVGSIGMWVTAEPPVLATLAPLLMALVLSVPPVALSLMTRYWLRRRRA